LTALFLLTFDYTELFGLIHSCLNPCAYTIQSLTIGGHANSTKQKGQKRPYSDYSNGTTTPANGGSNGSAPPKEEDKASRLASYAKLSLHKPGRSLGGEQGKGESAPEGGKHNKQRKDDSAGAGDGGEGVGLEGRSLSKAQKKNMKRHQRRKLSSSSLISEGP